MCGRSTARTHVKCVRDNPASPSRPDQSISPCMPSLARLMWFLSAPARASLRGRSAAPMYVKYIGENPASPSRPDQSVFAFSPSLAFGLVSPAAMHTCGWPAHELRHSGGSRNPVHKWFEHSAIKRFCVACGDAYLWVADPRQVTFLCLSKEKPPGVRGVEHPANMLLSRAQNARTIQDLDSGFRRNDNRELSRE
jgi:hypothetical protein